MLFDIKGCESPEVSSSFLHKIDLFIMLFSQAVEIDPS